MFERLKLFLQESRRELSRVNWPTREETMRLTGVVVGISLAIAIFLGAFDFLFLKGVQAIVSNAPVSAESPLQATTTNSTTTAGLPFDLVPKNVESNGTVKVTTEKPTETVIPINNK